MTQLVGNNQTVIAHESPACSNDSLLAIGCQGDVGAARVSAVE